MPRRLGCGLHALSGGQIYSCDRRNNMHTNCIIKTFIVMINGEKMK